MWQARILIGTTTSVATAEALGIVVPPGEEDRCWNCMSPDLDVYPHLLQVPPLEALVMCNGQDNPDWGNALGGAQQRRPARRLYGSEWVPSPLEFYEAIMLTSPVLPLAGRGDEVVRPGARGAAPRLAGALTSGEGVLPTMGGRVLQRVGQGGSDEDLSEVPCAAFARYKDKILAILDGDAVLAEFVDPEELDGEKDDGELDARVLTLKRSANGERARRFVDSLGELTQTEWGGWPVRGPRSTAWCLNFIGEQDTHPRARHTKWRTECDLTVMDPGVAEHELCMRLLDVALTFDQLNITELASFELICRRAQLAEFRYKDRLLGEGADEDEYLFMGVGETRGLVMVSPNLEDYLATQLSKESAVMKERRKMREERQLSRASAGGGGASGGGRLSRKEEARLRAAAAKGKGKGKDDHGGAAGAVGQ